MGVYKAAIVTESGQNLIAQALANEKPLIFTSAKTSSYSYPVGTNVPALTGLQDVVQSVIPSDSKVLNGNVAQVSVRFDNDGIDQAYFIQTIGLYAKIEDGAETLFSVTQATTPDEMPVQSNVSPSAYIYNIQHTVQNASQITLSVNPAGTATVQDVMEIENPEFDDSGTVSGISSFPDFLNLVKSKMNFFQFFRNFKAGMQFVLHAGQIVNNCVTDNAGLPLSAAQGKALMDKYTQLYSDLNTTNNNLSNGSVKSYFSPHKNNEADLCKGYNNSDGVFYFNYQGALVPIKKYVFSDGQGNGIFSSDQLVKNSDLPKNFKFLNLKYNTASSYDTEVLKYIESLKESVFIIYCQHGSASMYMGFIVGDGKYGTVLRFEYDSLYVNGCSGNAWAGWTKLG